MSEEALIETNSGLYSVSFTDKAHQRRQEALDSAALIGRVTNAAENELAVVSQMQLHLVAADVEKARKTAKEPVLAYGRAIDTAAKNFVGDIREEENRIAALVGEWQALQTSKMLAAEALRVAELNEIERRCQEQIAQAQGIDEIDAIRARANEEAAAVPVVETTTVPGQVVREDWDFTVVDIWLLARAHPNCVSIEPRRSEIRALLNSGITPAGVKAERVTKAGVRVQKEREALSV